jgi:hypothetical protein
VISDVLADAVTEIRAYLTNPVYAKCYDDPDFRRRLEHVLGMMDAIRGELDAPPDWPASPSATPEDQRVQSEEGEQK